MQVFEHMFKLPPRYFDHRPTGVLIARVHGVETIREFISGARLNTFWFQRQCVLVIWEIPAWETDRRSALQNAGPGRCRQKSCKPFPSPFITNHQSLFLVTGHEPPILRITNYSFSKRLKAFEMRRRTTSQRTATPSETATISEISIVR